MLRGSRRELQMTETSSYRWSDSKRKVTLAQSIVAEVRLRSAYISGILLKALERGPPEERLASLEAILK